MIDYELIRSRRRSVSLEITRDCRAVVRAPMGMRKEQIEDFVEKHTEWAQKRLAEMHRRAAAPIPPGVPQEPDAMKAYLRPIAEEKVAYWSAVMGVTPAGIRITAAKKRYGSCNAQNSLCFSCFLANCPDEAIDLVVVHELCHIKVKNHSPAFYALLSRYLPDWQERKKLLR